MGEVFDLFSKRKITPGTEAGSSSGGLDLNSANAALLIETIASFMETLKSPHGDTYQRYLKLVEKYSNEDLIGQLNAKDQNRWKTHPLFFVAVIDEAIKRKIL